MSMDCRLIAIVLLALVAPAAVAQDHPAVDAFGDPLPAGAIARLVYHDFMRNREVLAIELDRTRRSSPPFAHTISPDLGRLALAWSGSPEPDATVGAHLDLWNLEDGKRLFSSPLGSPGLGPVTFSPDGTRIAVGTHRLTHRPSMGDSKTGPARIEVFDAITGKRMHAFDTDRGYVKEFAVSADGTRLAAAMNDATILVWDIDPGE